MLVTGRSLRAASIGIVPQRLHLRKYNEGPEAGATAAGAAPSRP